MSIRLLLVIYACMPACIHTYIHTHIVPTIQLRVIFLKDHRYENVYSVNWYLTWIWWHLLVNMMENQVQGSILYVHFISYFTMWPPLRIYTTSSQPPQPTLCHLHHYQDHHRYHHLVNGRHLVLFFCVKFMVFVLPGSTAFHPLRSLSHLNSCNTLNQWRRD